MTLESNGITVKLEFDEDGFPEVSIDTGGGFHAENMRPTVQVKVNDVTVHEMFSEETDDRWDQ